MRFYHFRRRDSNSARFWYLAGVFRYNFSAVFIQPSSPFLSRGLGPPGTAKMPVWPVGRCAASCRQAITDIAPPHRSQETIALLPGERDTGFHIATAMAAQQPWSESGRLSHVKGTGATGVLHTHSWHQWLQGTSVDWLKTGRRFTRRIRITAHGECITMTYDVGQGGDFLVEVDVRGSRKDFVDFVCD